MSMIQVKENKKIFAVGIMLLIIGGALIGYAINIMDVLNERHRVINAYESLYTIKIYNEWPDIVFGDSDPTSNPILVMFFEGRGETNTSYIFDFTVVQCSDVPYIQNYTVLLNNSKLIEVVNNGNPIVYNNTIQWPKNTYMEFKIITPLCQGIPSTELRNSTVMYLAYKHLVDYLSKHPVSTGALELIFKVTFLTGLILVSISPGVLAMSKSLSYEETLGSYQ